MKRKNNIITTVLLICALVIITLLPLPVAEAANFTISKSNVSIQNGSSSTITIKAPTHTGRLDITSSNSNVATVSDSGLWVENNSKTITIYAKSVGTATITIKGELYDEAIGDEAEYSRTVNVTVTKATNSDSTNVGGSNTSAGTGNTQNNGNTSSSGQNSSTTNKPSSETTSKPSSSGSSTTKPSSGASTSKPTQNNTNVSTSASYEQKATTEESKDENTTIMEENVIQNEEVTEEELQEENEKNIIEEKIDNAEINHMEEPNSIKLNGRTIIIAVIGFIAIAMIFIGIGVSKNIFKK